MQRIAVDGIRLAGGDQQRVIADHLERPCRTRSGARGSAIRQRGSGKISLAGAWGCSLGEP